MLPPSTILGCVTIWIIASAIPLSGYPLSLFGQVEGGMIVVAALLASSAALLLVLLLAGNLSSRSLCLRGKEGSLVLLCLTALAEETIWRGYVLTKCIAHIGSLPGAVLSIILFALSHFMMGPRSIWANFWTGSVFTAVWFITGGLVFAMVSHVIYNFLWIAFQPIRSLEIR